MPTQCNPNRFAFAPADGRPVVASFDGGAITSDAGALLLGATDRVLGLTRRLAACFKDSRDPAYTEHTVEALVMQRVVGIALGYEDLNDHDQLRHDPVLATLAGKLTASRSDGAPLAGKSTLNRLELSRDEPTRYARIAADTAAIEALFVDLFLDAHAKAPAQITLDLDPTDDPLHGEQEGRFFHGYYDCYCYPGLCTVPVKWMKKSSFQCIRLFVAASARTWRILERPIFFNSLRKIGSHRA